MQKTEGKPQTRPRVDREAVRMLAIELGAREAARRLGIKESTVLSWARRYDWQLPRRKGGAISSAIKLQSKPGDALIAAHNELGAATKTALGQTLAKAAQALAKQDALAVENIAQFKDACLAGAKLFGWDGKQGPTFNIHNQVGIVCDEATRKRLIALRAEILARGDQAVPALPPVKETQSNANVGTLNANVATKPQNQPADGGVPQWMQDIGGASGWKHGKGSEPEDHAGSSSGSFGRWPEEEQ